MADNMYYLQIEINDLSHPDYEIAMSYGSSTFGLFHLLCLISLKAEDYIISDRIMRLQLMKINATENDLKNLVESEIIKKIDGGFYVPFAVDKLNGAFSKHFAGFFSRMKGLFNKSKKLTTWNEVIKGGTLSKINEVIENPIFLSLDTPLTRGLKSTLTTNKREENKSITEDHKRSSDYTNEDNKTDAYTEPALMPVRDAPITGGQLKEVQRWIKSKEWHNDEHIKACKRMTFKQMNDFSKMSDKTLKENLENL